MKVVSVLLGFGGGVLFATTFLHLIPEVTEGVNFLVKKGQLPNIGVAWAQLLACTG